MIFETTFLGYPILLAAATFRRVLVADANQHFLYSASEAGFPTSALDLGRQYAAYMPHQIICTPSASDTAAPIDADADADGGDFTVYIAEYIGTSTDDSSTINIDLNVPNSTHTHPESHKLVPGVWGAHTMNALI